MLDCKYVIFGSVVFILIVLTLGQDKEWNLANLNGKCMHCLCEAATGCDTERQCIEGYCGPYKVSKIYWVDADNVTMQNDDHQRPGAFEDCAKDYWCARRIVKKYLTKYGRDCNDDGVTDCYDYMMINFNGGWSCKKPLELDLRAGIDWVRRYNMCMSQ